jgi:hypothetical protein
MNQSEYDTIAITGSKPNKRAVLAVSSAILARSSAVGSGFIAVSDKNIGPRLVSIRLVVAMRLIPGALSITCKTGLTDAG